MIVKGGKFSPSTHSVSGGVSAAVSGQCMCAKCVHNNNNFTQRLPKSLPSILISGDSTLARKVRNDYRVREFSYSTKGHNGWPKPSVVFITFSLYCLPILDMYVCMYGHTYSESVDQTCKVANSARGQLNGENEYFPVRVRCTVLYTYSGTKFLGDVCCCCCCCFLTLTDPLRIQPWSQDRRNQTKSTGNRR